MNRIGFILLNVVLLSVVAGCNLPTSDETLMSNRESVISYSDAIGDQTPLTGSLFASDIKLLSNEAAQEILETPIPMRSDAKVALLNLTPGGLSLRVSRAAWRTEEYMDLQHRYVQTLVDGLMRAEKVREVVPIPSIMISEAMTLPLMREAAVRLQADLLLIYGIRNELFRKSRFLEKDEVKAYATCELLLLDARTGVIPFTTVLTEKYQTSPDPNDFGWAETQQRARSEATLRVLDKAGQAVAEFLSDGAKAH